MAQIGREGLLEQITAIVDRVAKAQGLEVVELEFLGGGKQRLLRIYIDKPEGVTHQDCELVSQQVGNILDAEDVVPGEHYTLEVSSPGVERKLTKPADFERFTGKKAKVVTHEPVESQKHWEGILRGVEGEELVIEPSEGRLIRIPLTGVKRANLKFEW
ncbi:MAG TPA: ribosome maturation factor RimP [Bryobacteraceae bacterium]|nr:ribosome maturation factor RimP [Bryobacteraceae bacterium]